MLVSDMSDDLSRADPAYLDHVGRLRAASLSGQQRLYPDGLWLAVSENCNFRCIGCWREGMFRKSYVSVEAIRAILADNSGHSYAYVSLTTGEAFLHPDLCDILELCREYQPQAIIDVISNGSIPPKGRFRKAMTMIDKLGLSIDGACAETFERIRIGGNFARFLENAREICAIRAETGFPRQLWFSFTANATNLAELPDVVRLAAEIGVPGVYAQPMEAADPVIAARIGQDLLDHLPPEEIWRIADEARATGARLGVKISLAAALRRPPRKAAAPPPAAPDAAARERAVRQCQYPYTRPFRYVMADDRFQVLPCCYMEEFAYRRMAERYGMVYDSPPSAADLYNSEAFWAFRSDLAEGRAGDLCGGCTAAQSFPWKPAP